MTVTGYDKTKSFTIYTRKDGEYVSAPEASRNGGLYTGELFVENAGYRDVPIKPDAFDMIQALDLGASPVPGSKMQFVDSHRPGNNLQILPSNVTDENGVGCMEVQKQKDEVCAYNSIVSKFARW